MVATGDRSHSLLPFAPKSSCFLFLFLFFCPPTPLMQVPHTSLHIYRTCIGAEQSWIISPWFINYELEPVLWEPVSGLLAETHQLNNRVSQPFD